MKVNVNGAREGKGASALQQKEVSGGLSGFTGEDTGLRVLGVSRVLWVLGAQI